MMSLWVRVCNLITTHSDQNYGSACPVGISVSTTNSIGQTSFADDSSSRANLLSGTSQIALFSSPLSFRAHQNGLVDGAMPCTILPSIDRLAWMLGAGPCGGQQMDLRPKPGALLVSLSID